MQENRVKQRVVGGVVLLALAVIIIPMVLDFRKDYDQVISGSNIPPKPKDFRIETFELNREPQVKVPTLSEAGSVERAVAQKVDEHREAEQKRAAETAAKSVESARPVQNTPVAPPRKSPAVRDGWAVQVGSFGSENNALRLRDKIRKRGYAAFVDSVNVNGKVSHRVRVGPEAEKSRAELLKRSLQQEMGLKGLVISHKG